MTSHTSPDAGFVVTVEQDHASDDLFIRLPPWLLESQDWRVGDTLSHEVLDGAWFIVNESLALRKAMSVAKQAPEAESLPLFIVETVMSHRIRYAIRARSAEHANDVVTMHEAEEFDQNPLDEAIFSTREVSLAEYLTAAELPTDPLRKVALIHAIDYSDTPAASAELDASSALEVPLPPFAAAVAPDTSLEGN